MSKCDKCKHLLCDRSVGYSECMKIDEMSDEEYEQYDLTGEVKNCPYYEEEADDYPYIEELLTK